MSSQSPSMHSFERSLISPIGGAERRWSISILTAVHIALISLLLQASADFKPKSLPALTWVNLVFSAPPPEPPNVPIPTTVVQRAKADLAPAVAPVVLEHAASHEAEQHAAAQAVVQLALNDPGVGLRPGPAAADAAQTAGADSVPAQALPKPTAARPAVPRVLPSSAVQYLQAPVLVYPRQSRRHGEQGRVVVRVFINEDGVPSAVVLHQSSGYPRLDEAAVTAVQSARFKPCVENGRPVAGWALVPADFNFEK
jgi:periplasmic protein TonB